MRRLGWVGILLYRATARRSSTRSIGPHGAWRSTTGARRPTRTARSFGSGEPRRAARRDRDRACPRPHIAGVRGGARVARRRSPTEVRLRALAMLATAGDQPAGRRLGVPGRARIDRSGSCRPAPLRPRRCARSMPLAVPPPPACWRTPTSGSASRRSRRSRLATRSRSSPRSPPSRTPAWPGRQPRRARPARGCGRRGRRRAARRGRGAGRPRGPPPRAGAPRSIAGPPRDASWALILLLQNY